MSSSKRYACMDLLSSLDPGRMESQSQLELIPVFCKQRGEVEQYLGSMVASREDLILSFPWGNFCSHGSELWTLDLIDNEIVRRMTQNSIVHRQVGSQKAVAGLCYSCSL